MSALHKISIDEEVLSNTRAWCEEEKKDLFKEGQELYVTMKVTGPVKSRWLMSALFKNSGIEGLENLGVEFEEVSWSEESFINKMKTDLINFINQYGDSQ